MGLFVGLDIGLNKTAICCVDNSGERMHEFVATSEPGVIIDKLRRLKHPIDLVGLEACTLSEWLYAGLSEAGFNVFCLETRHAQRFLSTRPNKTDRSDAHGIANMMRLGHFKPVHVKSHPSQLLRMRLAARKQFLSAILQIENTVRGLLRVQGLKIGRVCRNGFGERVRLLCASSPELLPAIEPLIDARDEMRVHLHTLTLGLEREARQDPLCKLFMTVPGVGPLTSLAFKATIDDPHRFKTSKLVPAHLGLTPRVHQSGETDRSGHITRSGDALLRYQLINAATSMLLISQKWCRIKVWGVKLAQRKGKPKAIVAVARKIAIVLHRIWLTGEPYRFGDVTTKPEMP